MKYQIQPISIPQDKRGEYNDKILYVVDHQPDALTPQEVFSAYTGVGGLHGLNRSDYTSYHSFSEAKKEIECGQFFTPHHLSEFVTTCVPSTNRDIILDPTMGMGNFFNYATLESNCYGCEIDPKAVRISKFLYPMAHLTEGDIRSYQPPIKASIIYANPPFNLKWGSKPSQFVFCEKAAEFLTPGGWLAMIVPRNFLADEFWQKSYVDSINNNFDFICQVEIKNNAFKNMGVENFSTKLVILQKRSDSFDHIPFCPENIQTDISLDAKGAHEVYQRFVEPRMKLFRTKRVQLVAKGSKEQRKFLYEVQKLLYHIEHNPLLNNQHAHLTGLIEQFFTQQQPSGMPYEEWREIRLTEEKVLKALKKVFQTLHKKELGNSLVRVSSGLKYRLEEEITPLAEMLNEGNYPFTEKNHKAWFNRKNNLFQQQAIPFSQMTEDKEIKEWLSSFKLDDSANNRTISLNDIQKYDTNLALQKNYAILQWEQGSGKSIAAIAYAKHRLQHTATQSVFVVSTALAIENTWQQILTSFGIPFVRIQQPTDLKKIKKGDFVLVSFNKVVSLKARIRRYLHTQGYKYTLIVDEADALINEDAKRTQAVIAVFRRAMYKLATTGTCTRNNITEMYPVFWLLFNGSPQFMSKSPFILKENKEGDLVHEPNKYYNKPYPSYDLGATLFRDSHNPRKITVFGVGQNTQDIFNADTLKSLLDSTVLTRTFEEVRGEEILFKKQATCQFNSSEQELYRKAIQDFATLPYWTKTGNPRKDAMLKIVQQIRLLIDICSMPSFFPEYGSNVTPSKFLKVLELVNQWPNLRIAIGCRRIPEVKEYHEFLSKHTDRPIFVATGNSTTLKKRLAIVKDLEKTQNGILISTQQSFSESVNIGFVDRIIVPTLAWNYPALSQYFRRFARFDSVCNHKEVWFVTYENSIEVNLLGLILAKEKLNQFIKSNDATQEEINALFGVDFDINEMALRRVKDEEGNFQIRWGNQSIS